MAKVSKIGEQGPPDEMQVNPIQARRLAKLTGLPEKDLSGERLATLKERLRWQVNPFWFLFELVCGKVVKVDPNTGLKYPVPGATVNVLDVDCDWLWFFPIDWPWAWAFPFGLCEVETVATTTTDECGNFCVWIPRFDIDWVLEWRKERICFPELFRRPSIADLLERLQKEVVRPPFPPEPNPPDPIELVGLLGDRQDLASAIGPGTTARLQALSSSRGVGAPTGALRSLLSGRAFTRPVPPPLHHEVKRLHVEGDHAGLADRIGVEAQRAEKLRLDQYYGPFVRCFDVYVPEWLPIFEVPDITFQVTQDTDADGDQEVIYESAFDVPWTFPMAEVELDVADFALALPSPGCGPDFPCEDVAAIQMVGLMPVDSGFLDATKGFATRPNPARVSGAESGLPTYPSTAPFEGTLQLYGCVHVGDAEYYRIMYEFAPGDALTGSLVFGAQQPMIEQWHVYHFGPFVDQVQQPVNSDGWYPILDDTWSPIHLLMNWNTGAMGVYRLTLQLGKMVGGSIQHLSDAPQVTFDIDNTAPTVTWNLLRWRYQGDVSWTNLPWVCPLIQRDPTRAVEVQVGISATAPHLRAVTISAGGCGGASPSPTSVDHWHTNEFDNSFTDSTIYTIPAHAQAGCYGWTVAASSRAFNPSGDNNGLALDWYYDPLEIWATPSISVAIVDA